MSFEKITPEAAGIASGQVKQFIQGLGEHGMGMHSLILAKGDRIFAEAYWAPFHRDFLHRMYSETKSFVGIAVCQLAAEGKLSLDDKIIDYFPDKLPTQVHPYLQAQTIRHMLTMKTCMGPGVSWFDCRVADRVEHYFHRTPARYPGTTYLYDSNGSFILSALVERVTGKDFLTYLRERCLDEIGFSREAHCLYAPGGYLWGDSALLCKTEDILRFIRLLVREGEYDGRQLLSREAVQGAVRKQIDNSTYNINLSEQSGYGFQIWHFSEESFAFSGMHGQYAIYHPGTDITMVCNGGFRTGELLPNILFRDFFEKIVRAAGDISLPEERKGQKELEDTCGSLKLIVAFGVDASPFEKEIDGRKFVTDGVNPMGITEFTLRFGEKAGIFEYVNAQGRKSLHFGRKENIFQKFPQTGYAKDTGSVGCAGHQYDCAVSAAWKEERKLLIFVQIIDQYMGLLDITIGFHDNYAVIDMKKDAEDFLTEYNGYANMTAAQKTVGI